MTAREPEGLREGVEALRDEARARMKGFPSHPHWGAWSMYEQDLRALLDAHPEPVPTPVSADDTVGERECRCAPCPGRGNDGHAMTHCAECCWGTGVEAEYGCPVHNPATPDAGDATTASEALSGTALVAAERRRQVDVEGWTAEHDQEHGGSVLYRASWAYRSGDVSHWPWDREWWKPKDRLSDLIRAGALLLAAEAVDEHSRAGYAVQRKIVEDEIDRLLASPVLAAREAAAATRARAEGAGPMSDEERARLGERLHAEGFYAPAVKVRIAVALDELLRDRADSIARSAS